MEFCIIYYINREFIYKMMLRISFYEINKLIEFIIITDVYFKNFLIK